MSLRVVGKPLERVEGRQKVAGSAPYTADILLPGMIWGKALRSPLPHARIKKIDISRALAQTGVLAVLTAQDFPAVLTGRFLRDMPVLARDKVRFIGERVAVVGAEDPAVAEEAASLIAVEYEELPAVFDSLEAMREGAPIVHEDVHIYNLPYKNERFKQPEPTHPNIHSHMCWSKGDIAEGYAEADTVFEQVFTTQYQHQGYLEPYAGVVQIDGEGRIQVWLSDKTPFNARSELAFALQIPEEQIRINLTHIGGDFGGKGSIMDVPLCYTLARKTGRPVKMVMTYAEVLAAANPRHPSVITLKSDVKKDGKIVARSARTVFNSGASGGFKPVPIVNLFGAGAADGVYDIPHVQIDSFSVYTNCVPCGHMRAPGEPQMIFAVESHTDMMADALGIDPYQFRRKNLLRDGSTTASGHHLEHVRVRQALEAAVRAAGYKQRKRKRNVGQGITITHRHIGTGESEVLLVLEEDGSFTIKTPSPDTGTGYHTILRQIAAETLSVPVNAIRVEVGTTDEFQKDWGPGASRLTHVGGQALVQATEQMKEKLLEAGATFFEVPPQRLTLQNGRLRPKSKPTAKGISLREIAGELKKAGSLPQIKGSYQAFQQAHLTSFCVQIAEVEVDPESGQLSVRRIVNAQDTGKILNPMGFHGQIQGGIIMGYGFALSEEIKVEEGRVITTNLGDYKLPNIQDIPKLRTVVLEKPEGPVPFHGKSIGEGTVSPVAAAIANAVYDAVGVRITDLPITAEKIHAALSQQRRATGGLS